MKILAIDTSGQQAGAAIVDDYITIGEIVVNAHTGLKNWHHSEILLPAVDKLLGLSGLQLCDIDAVAYTSGPGSFTGLRIGAATALGLARGASKRVLAVPTLDALAYNVLGLAEDRVVVPMMDARRGQVYTAVYLSLSHGAKHDTKYFGSRIIRVTEYNAISVEEILEMLTSMEAKRPLFLGDGADAYADKLLQYMPNALFAAQNANRQRAASVGVCAIRMVNDGRTLPKSSDPNSCDSDASGSGTVNLIYVRDPQAVREQRKAL